MLSECSTVIAFVPQVRQNEKLALGNIDRIVPDISRKDYEIKRDYRSSEHKNIQVPDSQDFQDFTDIPKNILTSDETKQQKNNSFSFPYEGLKNKQYQREKFLPISNNNHQNSVVNAIFDETIEHFSNANRLHLLQKNNQTIRNYEDRYVLNKDKKNVSANIYSTKLCF